MYSLNQVVRREIPSEYIVTGARIISENSNLSTVVWEWYKVEATQLRRDRNYSQITSITSVALSVVPFVAIITLNHLIYKTIKRKTMTPKVPSTVLLIKSSEVSPLSFGSKPKTGALRTMLLPIIFRSHFQASCLVILQQESLPTGQFFFLQTADFASAQDKFITSPDSFEIAGHVSNNSV